MSAEDRKDMVVDDKISMTCEFCSKTYDLDPAIIKQKIKDNISASSNNDPAST